METIRLLIVDDEDDFRQATARVLSRRGFIVTEVSSGKAALKSLESSKPDIVLLDLKMPDMNGLSTLEEIRKTDTDIPVIILTGHGGFDEAFSGFNLDIVDFVQKPVDVEQLAERIRRLLDRTGGRPLREKSLDDIIVSIDSYHRIYLDESLDSALEALRDSLFQIVAGRLTERGHNSVLVYDRENNFFGLIRARDIIRSSLPSFVDMSSYASYFTGMFLAHTKTMGRLRVEDICDTRSPIDISTPLIGAVHIMIMREVSSLAVESNGDICGILRERDVFLEIAQSALGD